MSTDPHLDVENSTPVRFWVFISVLLLCCVFVIYYAWNSAWVTLPDNAIAVLGQRGDFFGGFLNPILTFVTFMAFIYTIALQRTELHESRVQFKRSADALSLQNEAIRSQNYQASFFQLLSIHNDIVTNISVEDPNDGGVKIGRSAFQVIYSKIRKIYRDKRKRFPNAGGERALVYAYGTVYREHQYELGHYMRFLYNAIYLLKDNAESERFIKLLRAQISNQELLVLFYNCTASEFGKNFKILAEEYEFFNNMPPHLLDDSHASLIDDRAFGDGGYAKLKRDAGPSVRGDLSVRKDRVI